MNFELTSIESPGDLERERLVLKATADADIGRYVIFVARRVGEKNIAAGDMLGTYWFPDKQIKSGDFVVLYSKAGIKSEKENEGVTSHFFYWGLTSPRWTHDEAALLVELTTWKTTYSPKVDRKTG